MHWFFLFFRWYNDSLQAVAGAWGWVGAGVCAGAWWEQGRGLGAGAEAACWGQGMVRHELGLHG